MVESFAKAVFEEAKNESIHEGKFVWSFFLVWGIKVVSHWLVFFCGWAINRVQEGLLMRGLKA